MVLLEVINSIIMNRLFVKKLESFSVILYGEVKFNI